MISLLKSLLCPRRVMHAGDYLRWLGFDPAKELPKAFRAKGFQSKGFSGGSLTSDSPSSLEPLRCDKELLEIARYPICIITEKLLPDLDGDDTTEALFEKWLGILRHEYLRLERLFLKFRPHVVLLVQGYEPTNAIARLIAIEKQIPFLALENTGIKDRMLWDDQSGITTNCNLAQNFFWRYNDLIMDGRERGFVDRLIKDTKSRKTAEHASPVTQYVSKGEPGKPTVLFVGQVYTDSSVLFGSNEWSGPIEIIFALAYLSVDMGFRLILKLHPKEIQGNAPVSHQPYSKLTYRKLLESRDFQSAIAGGADVIIDHENEFDTYSLIAAASAVVTINSQTGLEAAIRNVPTVICGRAFYGGLGFTLEASDKEVLRIQVQKALSMEEPEVCKRTRQASKFAYIYFEKYCREKKVGSLLQLITSRCPF